MSQGVGLRALALLAWAAGGSAVSGQTGESRAELDLYVFRQEDAGGNPFRTEEFDYLGVRVGGETPLDEERSVHLEATVAYILAEDQEPLPATIANASTTSASGDLLTLDALAGLDFHPPGEDWQFRPSLFYHHQLFFIGAGVDLGLIKDLYRGNTQLAFTYLLRYDFLELDFWDGSYRGLDERVSHSFLLSWAQILSPGWRSNLSLQYSRQDGFLADQYNFVARSNSSGTPVLLVDERLPAGRDRFQLNGRLRHSPAVGTSVGVDASGYADSWGIRHVAVEPSFETAIGEGLRWRLWYRLSAQEESRFFRDALVNERKYQTQDSDLGAFTMHSPGTSLSVPLGTASGVAWEAKLSLYGFSRDDELSAFGGKLGLVWSW